MKREVKRWWKEQENRFELEFYSEKNNWKKSLPNINKTCRIQSIDLFFKKIDPWFKKMDESEAFRTFLYRMRPRGYYQEGWEGLRSSYNQLKNAVNSDEFNQSSLDNAWKKFINNWRSENLYFFMVDSDVWIQMNESSFKSEQELSGFLSYFMMTVSGSNNQDYWDGYLKASSINGGFDLSTAPEILAKTIEKHRKRDQEIDDKLTKLEEVENEITLHNKKITKEFQNQFEATVKEYEDLRNKFIISAPIEMWHKRLSHYTGKQYNPSDGEGFEFESSYQKRRDRFIKGKIKIYGWLSVIWAIIGICLSGVIFAWIENIVPDQIANHTKTIIVISTITSFAMLIYGYVLRILIKNWNTSRHIAEEIEERISLIQMYIALKQDGEQAHINHALKEIFKKIETGMIKTSDKSMNLSDLILKK